jgi:hypothetical protein
LEEQHNIIELVLLQLKTDIRNASPERIFIDRKSE